MTAEPSSREIAQAALIDFPKAPGARVEVADDELLIVAIVPAPPGWFAVWRDGAGELLEPVPMFALVECAWPERDPDKPGAPVRMHRVRWAQAMTHDAQGACTFELAERADGYCGMLYYAPGSEPAQVFASDSPA